MNELMKGRKKVVTGLVVFLGFMLLCTLVSKGIYASTLPQVTLQEPKKMSIQHEVSVPGNVKQSRELAVNVLAGMRVKEVAVMPGDKVGAGDTLFVLDTEYLEEQKQDMELEIRRLDLQISEVSNNLGLAAAAKDREMTRAGEDAVRDIQSADKNLNRAEEDEAKARAQLAEHQTDSVEITSDSRRAEKREAYADWKKEYREAQKEQASAQKRVNELNAEIEALEAEIKALEGTPASTPAEPEPAKPPESGSEPNDETPTETVSESESTIPPETKNESQNTAPTETESKSESPAPGTEGEPGGSVPEETKSEPESVVPAETQSAPINTVTEETKSEPEGSVPLEGEIEPENAMSEETGSGQDAASEKAYFAAEGAKTGLEEKKDRLERAKEELKDANQRLTDAAERVSILSADQVADPDADFSSEDAELAAWQAEEKSLQEKVKAAERGTEDKNDAKDDTLIDSGRNLEDNLTPENVDSTLALYKLERSKAKKNLEKITQLQEEEGRIAAERSGIITRVNVSPGDLATSQAAIVFADINEALQFEVFLDKDQKKYVNQGDEAEITLGSQLGGNLKVTVDYLTESESSPGSYSAVMKLPEDTGAIGQSGMFSLNAQADTYECCIPMEAMHEEFGDKYYVYVLEEKSSILGKELFVQKVSVNVLDKNDRYAAITPGIINKDSQLIYSSTKELEDSKVVRMKD